ncbi:hypothetical protein EDB19DRAFT_1736292 [Suillus lakei]|nr:hypothetical protein EDB19DRAFT_1736292 [Suillus lakei]
MRFPSVLAVVAVLAVSVSAVPSDTSEQATVCPYPIFCNNDHDCGACGPCVSLSSLRPGFNHMTHLRCRTAFIAKASVVAVSRVSVFSTSAVWLMT